MNIIPITSIKELPNNREFYLFDDEKHLEMITDLSVVVYKLTRKIKKEYTEWYVMKEEK